MIPSEQIRKIRDEIKERDRLFIMGIRKTKKEDNRYCELNDKYEDVEILFGHESTLSKSIIYFLDKQYEQQMGKGIQKEVEQKFFYPEIGRELHCETESGGNISAVKEKVL